MSDNVTLNSGTGGAVLAADDIGPGVWHQRVKVQHGADGSATDASDAAPLPVEIGDGTDQALVSAAGGLSVEVTAALPVGTNNIGDVDVLSVVPGTGATNLGKAVDSAGGATDTGVAPLAIRDDALAALTPIEGDYVPLRTDANGALWTHDDALDAVIAGTELQVDVVAALPAGDNNIGNVDIVTMPTVTVNAHAVTNAGTFAVQVDGAALTALQLIDDAVQVLGTDVYTEATSKGVTLGAVRRDADTTLVGTTNEFGPLQMDANGRLKVEAFSGETLPVSLTSTTVTAISAGDNNIGNVDVVTMPNVTLAAGTNTNEVVGDAAHDAAAAGNPLAVGGVAQDMDDTAPPNRVSAEGDAVRVATDRDGAQFVHPHGPQVWSYHVDGSAALTDASVHAAPGAGLSLYVTDIVVSKDAATAMNVFFEEGASKVLGPFYLEAVAGRGLAIHFQTPKKITANTALTVTSSAAIAHSVDVTGFTGSA